MSAEEIDFNDVVERVKDALAGNTSGSGATMLPTETSDEIIRIVYERNFLRGLLPALPMSDRTTNVPKLTGSIKFHQQTLASTTTGTAAAESSATTGEITLTQKTMIANIPIGNYLISYGIEGLLSVLRDDIASKLAYNETSLFINGDTETGTSYADNINGAYNSSTNVTGVDADDNDFLLLFDGLRKGATATAVSVSGTFALSHLRTGINNLGVYADNRDDLAFVVPRNLEVQLLGDTALQTVDKYGPGATILNGELGKIYGIRTFATGAIATNLNWTGDYETGGSTVQTKTTALLLNTRSPIIGNPTHADRRFAIHFHDEPTKDRFVLIPRTDVAFGLRYADAVCRFNGINTI